MIDEAWSLTLLLVVARIAGIFIAAPVLSSQAVPIKLRVLMSIVIGLAVVGRVARPAAVVGLGGLVLAGGSELAIGAVIGFAMRLVFVGIQLGAAQIGQQMGIALAEVFDPMHEAPGASRRLFYMVAIAVFLVIGGHRRLIAATLGSFDTVPVGGFLSPGAMLGVTVTLLGASFALALKVAAPVLVAMLLATVALGLLQKTIPQCNVLSIGLSARAMLAILILAAAVATLLPLMERAVSLTAGELTKALGGAS